MEFGFGVLHLAPDQFWRFTMREFWAAVEGVRRSSPGFTQEATPEEIEEAVAAFEELRAKWG